MPPPHPSSLPTLPFNCWWASSAHTHTQIMMWGEISISSAFQTKSSVQKGEMFFFCVFFFKKTKTKHHWYLNFFFCRGGGGSRVFGAEILSYCTQKRNFMHNQDITFPRNWLADCEDRILGSRPCSQVCPGNVAHADCQTAAGADSPRTRFVAFKKISKNNFFRFLFSAPRLSRRCFHQLRKT